MFHDPKMMRDARLPAEKPSGLLDRLLRRHRPAQDAEPEAHLPGEAQGAGPDIEALTCALTQLIASAQHQVDGAARLIGRSAEEAQAYGHALAHEARAMDLSDIPVAVASVLIDVTRSMIDRTLGAETRLREMGQELCTLQADLAEARACAERDPLTGLTNRRGLEKALARAVTAAQAAQEVLSLAFCDIDRFKQLNDTHGHAIGDRVLRHVGDCLADGLGPDATVGRYGGEEFVVLFEGVGAEQAAGRVDAVRAGLAARMLRSRIDDAPIGTVSFSAGIAMLDSEETGEDLLRRADEALYRAKDKGRNRVEIDWTGGTIG